ncbi:9098_t:CDS:2 [Diversispora eburnea]|uniref:9098_t:CDS:1 n=1 Tax=Diversispora eburnea TaxID=1213867 RepID=A0A9N9FRF5_9GLOM|nr:9098_t:CDS:2 [Diversispora eburnea]
MNLSNPIKNQKLRGIVLGNYCWNFKLALPGTLIQKIEQCNRSYVRYNKVTLKRPTFSQNIHTKRKNPNPNQ